MTRIRRKSIYVLILILVALFTGVALGDRIAPKHFEETLSGKTTKVTWEYVNLRQGPSTRGEPLTELPKGTQVTLTGYTCKYFGGDDKVEDSWTQVRLSDGTEGWVTTSALKR